MIYSKAFLLSVFTVLNLFVSIECINVTTAYTKLSGTSLLREVAKFADDNYDYNSATECIRDLIFWKRQFFSFEIWAISMFDSGGRFPSGFLVGNLHTLGQFDQCLRVYHNDTERPIKGKYCLAKLPITPAQIENLSNMRSSPIFDHLTPNNENNRGVDSFGRIVINWAVCLPNSCSASEIQDLFGSFLALVGINDRIPWLTVPEEECSVDEPLEWTGINIAGVVCFSIIAGIMLLSTCYDLYVHKIRKVLDLPSYHNVLAAFSLYTNTKRLTTISKSSSTLKCVHGVRMMSMFWVILGHRYTTNVLFPLSNTLDVLEWSVSAQSVLVLSGTLAVDSFLVLSGMLVSYVLFKQYEKKKSFNLPMFYLHRLIRLTPALAAIIFFQVSLNILAGSGPMWKSILPSSIEDCQNYWWMTLLHLQNYLSPANMCIAQAWYLCVDTQLYVLSPILIYPLMKNKKIGIGNLIFWIVAALATLITIVYINDWAAAPASIQTDPTDYTHRYYYATHMRATPWLLGFAAGYLLCYTTKREIKMNKFLALSLWIASLAVMAAVIFGIMRLQSREHVISKLEDGTYNAFARPAWALSLLWIIFACIHGYGGPANWFLSFGIWEILSRISYSMYLLHITIQYILTFSSRTVYSFMPFFNIYLFFGDVLVTIFFSYFWAMAFESPFMVLEKAIFSRGNPTVEDAIKPNVQPTIENAIKPNVQSTIEQLTEPKAEMMMLPNAEPETQPTINDEKISTF